MVFLFNVIYKATLGILFPLNYIFSKYFKYKAYKNSVLHIAFMVHIPYYTVQILRKYGMKTDFLAIGVPNQTWNKADFHFIPPSRPLLMAIQEFVLFWKVMAKYEIIHSHNMVFLTESGWEDKWLKRMGRKIVVNYRGCDIRDRIRAYNRIIRRVELYQKMERSPQGDRAGLIAPVVVAVR